MTQNNNFTQGRYAGVKSIGKPDWIGRFWRKLQRYSGFHSAGSDSSTALNRTASGFTALACTSSGGTRNGLPGRSSIAGAHSVSRGPGPQNSSTLISRSVAAFFAALALVLCMGSAAYAADDSSKHFEIKAKPLADALMEFGVQSGLTVVAPTTLTAGKKAAAVRGDLAPTDALGRLLKGSDLTFARAADGTIAIQAIPSNGPVQASAGESDLDKDLTPSDTLTEVIVTGTRQTGVRASDSPAPITLLDANALTRVGQPDLNQSLQQNLPSFNAQPFGFDAAALTVSAALRGLSPNNTLVLVNGKRRHSTANLAVNGGSPYTGAAAVDLGLIPVAAIDHVEVLQDGAAAQYGSDAIGGVVNVMLKNQLGADQ